MDIFHVLTMLGGLCLFLFGMNFMGQSLERRAGGKLRTLLDKMTGEAYRLMDEVYASPVWASPPSSRAHRPPPLWW